MKKIALLLALILLTYKPTLAQDDCSLSQQANNIFTVQKRTYNQKDYLYKEVKNLDSNHCLSPYVQRYKYYLGYLQTHFHSSYNYQELISIKDSVKRQLSYASSLETDSLFQATIKPLDEKISNADFFVPDTISIDQMLNIAVKYFTITKINDAGNYVGKVCTGINSIRSTEPQRQAHLEAFCFSNILENYQGEKYNLYNEFILALKAVSSIRLGIDAEEKLFRAQGAMFLYMHQSKVLKNMLIEAYHEQKDFLPFVLQE